MNNTILRFPQDDKSVGSFRTKLTFKTWGQSGADAGENFIVAGNPSTNTFNIDDGSINGKLTTSTIGSAAIDWVEPKMESKYEFVIWLPMPLQLGTGYAGEFSENDDMFHLDREEIIGSGDKGYLGLKKAAGRTMTQLTKEIANITNKIVTPNSSVKMSRASVLNNNMGMIYNGARLRSHTFTWRLTPKSIEEQETIVDIIQKIKMASTPGVSSISGEKYGYENISDSEIDEVKDSIRTNIAWENKKIDRAKEKPSDAAKGIIEAANQEIQRLTDELDNMNGGWSEALSHITSLSIPDTVSMSFYKDYRLNPNLFNINDSFITSFDINYTVSGGWTSHLDGAPLETQITMTLKEIAPITKLNISEGGN